MAAGYSVTAWQNLVGLVWKGMPSVEGVRELEAMFERVAASDKRKIGFATRIHPSVSPEKAPGDVRTGVGALLKRHGARIGATVVIYEAHGLRATIIRTVISTINLLGGARFPSQVHVDTLQGVLWLTRQLGAAAPAEAEKRLLTMLSLS
jgi:hypothetical protein